MRFFKNYLLLPCVVALSLISCKDDDSATAPFIKLTTESGTEYSKINVSKSEHVSHIWLQSNVHWEISVPETAQSWIAVSPQKGSGNASLKLVVNENSTATPRNDKFVVSVQGMRDVEFEIWQSGGDEVISATADKSEIGFEGGNVSFKIESNCEWKYTVTNTYTEGVAPAFTEESKTDSTLVLAFAANHTQSNISYKVTFTGELAETSCNVILKSASQSLAVPDLLDIEFLADGTAKDVSLMGNKVTTIAGATLSTYYNDELKRYVAKFDNPMYSFANSGYYSVDYTAGGDFINRIGDGCSFETIFRINKEHSENKEMKWFSSMAAGGIGFLLANESNGKSITFLPNINSNYIWTKSGREARVGQFYHVVGVYNKVKGTSSIYINGELMEEAIALGNYTPVASGAERFIIGGDAAVGPGCETSINGEVAMARIYSEPLTDKQIHDLWKASEFKVDNTALDIYKVLYLPEANVAPGYKFSVYGKGFADGDKISLSATDSAKPLTTVVDSEKATVTIPADFQSGSYFITVIRGSQSLSLGTTTITVTDAPHITKPKIIAHRGIHVTGETENSVGSLREAMKFNAYGSELDVHITTDGKVVVHHDGAVGGQVFQNCTYDEIKNITLSNGEKLPTFEDMIKVVQEYKDKSQTKMIVEFKTGSIGIKAVDVVMKQIEEANLKDRVEYISFGYDICQHIVAKDPTAIVGYLGGGFAPASVNADGIKSIDYNTGVFDKYPSWISDAQTLGMIVNVWTVNDQNTMLKFIGKGVDYITTDQCALLKSLVDKDFVSDK